MRLLVYDLLGGRDREQLTLAEVISMDKRQMMAKKAQQAIEKDHRSLGVKVRWAIGEDVE